MSWKRFGRIIVLILSVCCIFVLVVSCGNMADYDKQKKSTEEKKTNSEKGSSSQGQEKGDPDKQARDLIRNPNF